MSNGSNCWKYFKPLEKTGGNIDSFAIYKWDKDSNCATIKEKPIMWRLEEESDRDVVCHQCYLYNKYLKEETLAEVGDFKIGGRIINK